ncbi:class I SAM-dependent methyltransferase [Alkalisalibacterium limincola]|nr:class I SAM-dependent methyltransferase [Alkalisalibacterium limincola]
MRFLAKMLRSTPLHPQWLIRRERLVFEKELRELSGLTLDVGCGDRWLASHLPRNCQYVGVDYPATGKTLYNSKPEIYADASLLPFPDETFDCLLMFEVLEHFRKPGAALAEAARVLARRGTLVLSVPFIYPLHDEPYDFQRFTIHGLVRDLDEAGFTDVSMSRRLNAIETAALTGAIALASSVVIALKQRSPTLVLAPALLLSIPVLNLLGRIFGILMPDWPALTNGYVIRASRKHLGSQDRGGDNG